MLFCRGGVSEGLNCTDLALEVRRIGGVWGGCCCGGVAFGGVAWSEGRREFVLDRAVIVDCMTCVVVVGGW
jgi:hypothetical protein